MKSTLTLQEKYQLGNFALDWQKTYNKKLSLKFLQVFTEITDTTKAYKFCYIKKASDYNVENMTVKEIANLLGITRSAVYKQIQVGNIKNYKKK